MAEAPPPPGCPACGCPDVAQDDRIFDHEYALDWSATYARCKGCGTCYQTPMPSAEALGNAYPPDYHSMGRGGFLVELRYRMRLRRLSPYLGGPGAVLDFGCGDGSFLAYAARNSKTEASRARQWFGYEISDTRQVEQLEDGRVTVVRGREADLWDVLPECCLVTLNHVIEHLPNPRKTLESLLKFLSVGGTLEGQTPAAGSLEHRVFDRRWSGYHAPRHTVIFSRTGLAEVLKRAGFADVRVSGAFNPAGIAVSLATLPHAVDAPSRIPRQGLGWMFWLSLAAGLGPLDLLSGRPGIVDFAARRTE